MKNKQQRLWAFIVALLLLALSACNKIPSSASPNQPSYSLTEQTVSSGTPITAISTNDPSPTEAPSASIASPPPESAPSIEYSASPTPEATPAPEVTAPVTPPPTVISTPAPLPSLAEPGITAADIPAYSGADYAVINGNIPFFPTSDLTTQPFEYYSDLDSLGRCGAAYANICREIMPTEERGNIGMIKPSGWHTIRYDDLVEGKYLYNRCHLIAFQLAGENANEKNLITGTRWMNVGIMLSYESQVENYVISTGNHVLYRSTPIFEGNNLVANGILLEAMSVEDNGTAVCFNVFLYNVQPGIVIDYATGDSWIDEETSREPVTSNPAVSGDTSDPVPAEVTQNPDEITYILNQNTKKFHYPYCSSVADIKEKNKVISTETRDEIIAKGYAPCGRCHP